MGIGLGLTASGYAYVMKRVGKEVELHFYETVGPMWLD